MNGFILAPSVRNTVRHRRDGTEVERHWSPVRKQRAVDVPAWWLFPFYLVQNHGLHPHSGGPSLAKSSRKHPHRYTKKCASLINPVKLAVKINHHTATDFYKEWFLRPVTQQHPGFTERSLGWRLFLAIWNLPNNSFYFLSRSELFLPLDLLKYK